MAHSEMARKKSADDRLAFRKDNPEVALHDRFNSVENELRKLRRERKEAQKADQKERVKLINQRISAKMKQANESYARRMEKQ
jgi:hypothetical protein